MLDKRDHFGLKVWWIVNFQFPSRAECFLKAMIWWVERDNVNDLARTQPRFS